MKLVHCFSLGLALFLTGGNLRAQDAWGNIKGRVVWAPEKLPKPQVIMTVDKSPDKAICCKNGPIVSDTWVVNEKNGGLRWTFVWLAPVKPEEKMPIHPKLEKLSTLQVEMDQPNCMFSPHALGMREGQTLLAKNSMSIAHNFKWTGNPNANPGGNVLIAPGGAVPIKKLVADRLPIRVECNVHSWMGAWVRVFDHPYFAVTDADGNFEIKDAPAGEYRLMVWHGSGGWLGGAKGKNGQPVNIPANDTKDVGELRYQPPE